MKNKLSTIMPIGVFTTLFIGVFYLFFLVACTENERAKAWGGKMTVELPANQKLVNVTWKETDLWVLTKPMTATDVPETYKFSEKSTFGMMEGEITLKETR
jgi:hypothetical protein